MNITGKVKHNFVFSDTLTNKLVFVNEDGEITNEIADAVGTFDFFALPGAIGIIRISSA